jgi:hypothetical protein
MKADDAIVGVHLGQRSEIAIRFLRGVQLFREPIARAKIHQRFRQLMQRLGFSRMRPGSANRA